MRKWRCTFVSEPLNHIHQDTKSARLIKVCKRSLSRHVFFYVLKKRLLLSNFAVLFTLNWTEIFQFGYIFLKRYGSLVDYVTFEEQGTCFGHFSTTMRRYINIYTTTWLLCAFSLVVDGDQQMTSNPHQQTCFSFFMPQKSFNKPFKFLLYKTNW